MTSDDFDSDEHDRHMAEIFAARMHRGRTSAAQLSDRLAELHNIGDHKAHRALVTRVRGLSADIPSWPTLDAKNWSISRDLSSWEEARKQLSNIARGCELVIEVMRPLDPVVLEALRCELEKTTPHHDLPDLLAAVRELHTAASAASAIKGRAGAPAHPEWMFEAARVCMSFWEKQRGERPTAYFRTSKKPSRRNESQTTSGNNAFSRWFSDLMKEVASASPSTCETLIRKVAGPG